jgi:S1-C subfamily serine protease
VPLSPADRAGLSGISEDINGDPVLGDVITHVDDHPITSKEDLFAALDALRPGDPLSITLWHKGQSRTLTLKAAALPE